MGDERRRAYSEEQAGEAGIRMCGRKQRYSTELAATTAGLRKYGKVMRAYRCPICHGWHMTSQG